MAMTVTGHAAGPIGDPMCPRTRIYMHYLAHRFFLRDGELLEGLDALRDIRVDIVQGALDPVCPPISAWELANRLPHARVRRVPLAGHGAFEPALSRALVESMDALRDAPR